MADEERGVDPRKNVASLRSLGMPPPPPVRQPKPPPPPAPTDDRQPSAATPATASTKRPTKRAGTASASQSDPNGVRDPRSRPTTLYLPGPARAKLAAARTRSRHSRVDLILDAVSAEYTAVKAATPAASKDSVLGITRRRPRLPVDDGRPEQVRLSADEKAALARLATEAGLSVSALVAACLDRHDFDN